jgi:hypothetical protein
MVPVPPEPAVTSENFYHKNYRLTAFFNYIIGMQQIFALKNAQFKLIYWTLFCAEVKTLYF